MDLRPGALAHREPHVKRRRHVYLTTREPFEFVRIAVSTRGRRPSSKSWIGKTDVS
jgi:hypothetical protein